MVFIICGGNRTQLRTPLVHGKEVKPFHFLFSPTKQIQVHIVEEIESDIYCLPFASLWDSWGNFWGTLVDWPLGVEKCSYSSSFPSIMLPETHLPSLSRLCQLCVSVFSISPIALYTQGCVPNNVLWQWPSDIIRKRARNEKLSCQVTFLCVPIFFCCRRCMWPNCLLYLMVLCARHWLLHTHFSQIQDIGYRWPHCIT